MKSEIRKQTKLKRTLMTAKEVEEKSLLATDFFLSSQIYKNCKTLMVYMPLGNETDTRFIIKQAYADGKKLVFPITEKESGVITAYYAEEGSDFVKGAFNVSEPLGGEKAELCDIDLILVPGIAFDQKGTRVGFGKGCYDRLLQNADAIRVGFCYDFQIYNNIPADEHDVSMEYLVTENGVFVTK